MRHRTNKFTFGAGIDANSMMMRKLMKNFIRSSHIETTITRAKALKVYMDRIVSKTRVYSEANKNYLLRYFPEKKYQRVLFNQIGPAVAKISGGYVRIVRLGRRNNDGALMARLEWAHPVVIDWENSKSMQKPAELKKSKPSPKKNEKKINVTKEKKEPKKAEKEEKDVKSEKKVTKTK